MGLAKRRRLNAAATWAAIAALWAHLACGLSCTLAAAAEALAPDGVHSLVICSGAGYKRIAAPGDPASSTGKPNLHYPICAGFCAMAVGTVAALIAILAPRRLHNNLGFVAARRPEIADIAIGFASRAPPLSA